jgi:hypothetical protein
VIVGDQESFYGCADGGVVPDHGQGQQPGSDAGVNTPEGASAVGFEGELAFKGIDDGLDPLAAAGELTEPGGLVLAVGADQVRAQPGGDEGLKVPPGEALAAEDDLPGADQVMITGQQGLGDLAFAQAGMGQPPI